MAKGKYKIFIILGIIVIAAIGFIALYKFVIRKPYDDLAKLNKTVSELEKENQELKDQVAKNETITREQSNRKLGAGGIFFLILSIVLIGVIIYLIKGKNIGQTNNMEEITKFLRGTPEKDYQDGYIYKIDGRRLYKRVSYETFSYKGQEKFKHALIIFCLNKHHNAVSDMYYREPPKEQLIGYIIDRTNLKEIVATFDRGDMDCKEMLEAAKLTHWGQRGIHWLAHEKPEWERELDKLIEQKQTILLNTAEVGKAFRGED